MNLSSTNHYSSPPRYVYQHFKLKKGRYIRNSLLNFKFNRVLKYQNSIHLHQITHRPPVSLPPPQEESRSLIVTVPEL